MTEDQDVYDTESAIEYMNAKEVKAKVDPGAAVIKPPQVMMRILFAPYDDKEMVESLAGKVEELFAKFFLTVETIDVDYLRARDTDECEDEDEPTS